LLQRIYIKYVRRYIPPLPDPEALCNAAIKKEGRFSEAALLPFD